MKRVQERKKQCRKCHVFKYISEFYNGTNTCKECKKEYFKEHRRKPEIKKKNKEYYYEVVVPKREANPEIYSERKRKTRLRRLKKLKAISMPPAQ